MKANCDCGKFHATKNEYNTGDKVRVRVHWRCRHMTGVVRDKRLGFNEGIVYDVALDEPFKSGLAELRAMRGDELWAE